MKQIFANGHRSKMHESTSLFFRFGVVALWFGLAVGASQAQETRGGAIVIDGGVDFSHTQLSNNLWKNMNPVTGAPGLADPEQVFSKALDGWNLVSSDEQQFPDFLKAFYNQNSKTLSLLADLWSQVENDDPKAIQVLRARPDLQRLLGFFLGTAHGTHVAGLVEQGSLDATKLQSINVFTGSKDGSGAKPSGEIVSFTSERVRFALMELEGAKPLALLESGSFLDSEEAVVAALKNVEDNEMNSSRAMLRYLLLTKPQVVNLSLGSALVQITKMLELSWRDELRERGLPIDTPRTAAQEANFKLFSRGIFAAVENSWRHLFANNPNVLFVIAAGNDGAQQGVENPGNNDLNLVTPANLSAELPNVLTVAATTKDGALTDFSNYSASKVQVGAFGKAVPSLAPGGLRVSMSGTSMASPLVAGIAVEVRRMYPALSASKVRDLIEGTVQNKASLRGKVRSGGVAHGPAAFRAVQLLLSGMTFDGAMERAREEFFGGFGFFNLGDLGTLPKYSDTTQVGQVERSSDLVLKFLPKF